MLMEVVMVEVVVVTVDVGDQGMVAVGAAARGAATADAAPARVQAALGAAVVPVDHVHAAAGRGTRRHGGRRGGQEAGRVGWRTWLAQATVQNQFEVVPRAARRHRLAAHQSRHR